MTQISRRQHCLAPRAALRSQPACVEEPTRPYYWYPTWLTRGLAGPAGNNKEHPLSAALTIDYRPRRFKRREGCKSTAVDSLDSGDVLVDALEDYER